MGRTEVDRARGRLPRTAAARPNARRVPLRLNSPEPARHDPQARELQGLRGAIAVLNLVLGLEGVAQRAEIQLQGGIGADGNGQFGILARVADVGEGFERNPLTWKALGL